MEWQGWSGADKSFVPDGQLFGHSSAVGRSIMCGMQKAGGLLPAWPSGGRPSLRSTSFVALPCLSVAEASAGPPMFTGVSGGVGAQAPLLP